VCARARARVRVPGKRKESLTKLEKYLMVLSVRILIQCGMGRFCFCFFANFFLILNVFWEGYNEK
jgi:hypothetical protein